MILKVKQVQIKNDTHKIIRGLQIMLIVSGFTDATLKEFLSNSKYVT